LDHVYFWVKLSNIIAAAVAAMPLPLLLLALKNFQISLNYFVVRFVSKNGP
jgi:hypothetical protein